MTNANAGRVAGRYIQDRCGLSVRNLVNAGRSIETKKWSRVMKKTLVTLAVGATVAIGAVTSPTPAEARWRHGFPVAPVVGGLAAGALLGAALAAPRPYYGYAYEPVHFGPRCYVRRERFWDGWGWHVRRVEDCY